MDQAPRYRIAEGLGESLMLAARFDDAERQLDRATEVAQDDDQRHRIQLLLGQLELWRNDLFKAIDVLSRLLRELGCSVPKTNLGFAMGAIKQAIVQRSHTAFPKWHLRSRQATDRHGKLGNDALNFLSKSYWFQNTPRLFWAHLTALKYTEQSTDSSGMATAYSYHSIIISVLGLTKRGQRYNQKSLAIYEQLDDRLGVGCLVEGLF